MDLGSSWQERWDWKVYYQFYVVLGNIISLSSAPTPCVREKGGVWTEEAQYGFRYLLHRKLGKGPLFKANDKEDVAMCEIVGFSPVWVKFCLSSWRLKMSILTVRNQHSKNLLYFLVTDIEYLLHLISWLIPVLLLFSWCHGKPSAHSLIIIPGSNTLGTPRS